LSKYEHTQDGNTPQVDLVHLLAAREQELRAIAAERDQLQAEVRLARGFISERDADILRVRAINDQYVEENERLRAMLDEWSSRTAKLELALQTERVSTMESHRNHTHLLVSST
jgi:Tfp pilus assembly protein PilP